MKVNQAKIFFFMTEIGIASLCWLLNLFEYGYVMSSIVGFFGVYVGTKFFKMLFWHNFQEKHVEKVVFYIKKYTNDWGKNITVEDFKNIPSYKNFEKIIKPFSILLAITLVISMILFPLYAALTLNDEWTLISIVYCMIALSGISIIKVLYPISCAYRTTRLIRMILGNMASKSGSDD
jgi:hypothetical protein